MNEEVFNIDYKNYLLFDGVKLIFGNIIKIIESKGWNNCVDIYYKGLRTTEWFSKPKVIMGIPKEGIVIIPPINGYGIVFIASYGDNTTHPPLFEKYLKLRFNELVQTMHNINEEVKLKKRVIETKERMINRDIDKKLEENIKRLKELNQAKQPIPFSIKGGEL